MRQKQHKLQINVITALPIKRIGFVVRIAIHLVIFDEIRLARYTAKPC